MLPQGAVLQNRYRVVNVLGIGGMGAVYQAQDIRLGQIVALKENVGGDVRQFQQEALLLAHLRHPNLPRVSDHFIEPSSAQYLVMDFVEGEDLELWRQRQGALMEKQVVIWIDQILDAVAYLHNCGVIHRDIKPSNIKITTTSQAVLVDFGIAKIYQPGQSTMTGAKAATPGFAAPEQYRGGTDHRSDIYSLGATVYALVTGCEPPDARTLESGAATLTPPRVLNSTLSIQIEPVILQAMAIQPSQRFPSANEMRLALKGARVTLPKPIPKPAPLRTPGPSPIPKTIPASRSAMPGRIMGVFTLKAPVYKQIAEDTSATTTAAIIVVVMAIIGGILGALTVGLFGASLSPDQLAQMGSPVKIVISTIINTIIGWLVGSAVFAFIANAFGGKTNTGEMLRVFGFTQVFQVLNIIPCLGTIAALILSVIGAIIGIREAAEFSTGKAVLTGVVGLIVLFIVQMVIGLILSPILG